MKIPAGLKEEDVLALIRKISKKLAYKFIFPPYTYDDVVQEGMLIGIQGLDKYSDVYPLEHFLWVHIRRRLCTFKRDNYMRLNKPCLQCPFKAYIKRGDICKKYDQKEQCDLYVAWQVVTEKKKNIIAPISMDHEHYEETDLADDLSHKEILALIDNKVSIEMRHLWLQLKGGVKLNRSQMAQIRTEVENILQEHNVDVEQWF